MERRANTTNVLLDTIMAARYAAVVRKLGGKIEIDLDTEIKIAGAQGDVAKTIQCIETVLTDREADDVANSKGLANAAKFDPRKTEKPTKWTSDLRPLLNELVFTAHLCACKALNQWCYPFMN